MNNLELKDMEWTEDLFEPLDSSEQNSEFIAMESKTFLQDSWNRFKKNKLALVGLVFLVLMILMAIFVLQIQLRSDGYDRPQSAAQRPTLVRHR